MIITSCREDQYLPEAIKREESLVSCTHKRGPRVIKRDVTSLRQNGNDFMTRHCSFQWVAIQYSSYGQHWIGKYRNTGRSVFDLAAVVGGKKRESWANINAIRYKMDEECVVIMIQLKITPDSSLLPLTLDINKSHKYTQDRCSAPAAFFLSPSSKRFRRVRGENGEGRGHVFYKRLSDQ